MKDPAARYPDAVAFASAFGQAALGPAEEMVGLAPDGACTAPDVRLYK